MCLTTAKRNIEVELFEMKPDKMSPAHNLEALRNSCAQIHLKR